MADPTELDTALCNLQEAWEALAHMEPQHGKRKRLANHLRGVRRNLECLRDKRDEMVAQLTNKADGRPIDD